MHLHFIRLVSLGLVSIFSIIVLGISADLIHLTEANFGVYFVSSALALAVSLLTLITILPMMIIDTLRKGAFTSMVVFELVWTFILWVLWIATAALASQDGTGTADCAYYGAFFNLATICHEFNAIEGFAHVTWLIFLIYFATLLVSTIRLNNNGHNVWQQSVKETDFWGPGSHPVGGAATAGAGVGAMGVPEGEKHHHQMSSGVSGISGGPQYGAGNTGVGNVGIGGGGGVESSPAMGMGSPHVGGGGGLQV